ncbi:TPA: porin [Salmonella enterica subsp. enterica serovar Vietnam]|nr:porin [Salmonella enterica]
MKRKVLALVIPALLAAGAAHAAEVYNKDGNKLDLYGKVDGLHYFSDDSSKDGDQTYVRFGFKGETQINDQLTGYGQWEYNVQANTTEGEGANSWTRLAFAGLKFGDYGSFDYGRNYGVLYDVEGWTDMLPEFGGDSYTYADNYMTGRANGVATYRNTDFFGLVDGLNFALQYQGKNESQSADDVNIGTNNRNDDGDIRYDNGDGFGISTTYDIGMGFSAGAAYTTSDRTNEQVNWLIASYGLQSIGELMISGLGLAMVAQLVPQRLMGFIMGSWFLTTAGANIIGGYVANLMAVPSDVTDPLMSLEVYGRVFMQIGVATAVIAVLMLLTAPKLNRMTQDDDTAEKGSKAATV